MDKFSAMQAFVRVVESGNFTRAADLLGVPKPTVTRLVQDLEKALATQLLNRTTRKVTVTTDGAAYYEQASRLLEEVHQLEANLSRAQASPGGKLKVDLPSSLGLAVIIPALPEFCARYPDITLEVGISDRPVDLLSENVDCVVRGGAVTDQSLVARRIGEYQLMCCASPGYLQRHGVPQHPRELDTTQHRTIRFVLPHTGKLHSFNMHRDGEVVLVGGNHQLSVNDSNAGVVAALAGLGVLPTLTFLVQDLISSGALEPLFPGWCTEVKPVYVVYPPNRHLSKKVRVFVDWIAELFEKHDLMQRKSSLPCSAALAARGLNHRVVNPVATVAVVSAASAFA